MRLNCGPTKNERRQDARNQFCKWHRWFAWFPVRVGSGDCRWLEHVERRAKGIHEAGLMFEFTPYEFTYRPITN